MTNIASLPLRVTLEVRLGLIGMALAIVVSACAKPRPLAAIPEQIENGAETFPIPEFVELDIEAAAPKPHERAGAWLFQSMPRGAHRARRWTFRSGPHPRSANGCGKGPSRCGQMFTGMFASSFR